jgi:Xaa-Pro aminopeptidase
MKLTVQERDRRHKAVRKMMEEKDLTILVIASNAMWTGHVRYVSNYPPHFGYSYVVFPRDGEPTIFVFSGIQERVAAQRWISDARQSSNYPADIVKRIKELDYNGKRIGLVGVENISFTIYEQLKNELPAVTFVNAGKEIFDLRMIKSAEEQTLARECARITDGLYKRIKEVAKIGMSEFDIYAEMDYFMRKQGVETAFNLIGTGNYPVAPFLAPSGRVLSEGESLIVELTPRYEGYYTQLTVVTPLAEPTPKMKEFLNIGVKAQQKGVALLAPGNKASDVANVMKQYIEEAGFSYPYRGGHSMGHDLDEPPAIVPQDATVLQPGMTIVIHPCVMDKSGDGVFLGDTYLITEKGPEALNHIPLK